MENKSFFITRKLKSINSDEIELVMQLQGDV